MPVHHTSPPYQPLQSSPTARTFTVRQLLGLAESGRIRVPEFQRPLRWRQAQNLELLDSVWRNYPIGSLLLWKKPAPAGPFHLGAARLEAEAQPEAYWVVDGQQRLTALTASLSNIAQPPGEKRWQLYFDVAAQGFSVSPGETTIPVQELGDMRRLNRYLRSAVWAEDEALFERAEVAQQRLLDYHIPAYVVEADDEVALKAIFARLNSTGARMRSEEVFHALVGTAGTQPLDLTRLQQVFEAEEFGTPSRAEVLKMVLAMSGEDPAARVERFREEQVEKLVDEETAEETIRRVLDFLKSVAGILHLRLIPYPVVLSILARWFREHPETDPWNLRRLGWWLWSGAGTAVHQRAEVSKMRHQLRLIDADQGTSMDRLLREVGQPDPSAVWQLKRFNGQSAHSRIEMLGLLALKPRSIPHETEGVLVASAEISVGALISQDRVAREIIASTDWRGLSERHVALAKSGANRVLLEEGHSGLGARFRGLDAEADRAILESHLMTAHAFELLCAKDYAGFLEARAADLIRCVDTLVQRGSGTVPSLRFLHPIDDYLDDDDEAEK